MIGDKISNHQFVPLFQKYTDAYTSGQIDVNEYVARTTILNLGYAWDDTSDEDKKQAIDVAKGVMDGAQLAYEREQVRKLARKPYSDRAGYIASRPCTAECGGWIVIYDRSKGTDIDADFRWIVMHEPSSTHVAIKTKAQAVDAMHEATDDPALVFGVPIESMKGK